MRDSRLARAGFSRLIFATKSGSVPRGAHVRVPRDGRPVMGRVEVMMRERSNVVPLHHLAEQSVDHVSPIGSSSIVPSAIKSSVVSDLRWAWIEGVTSGGEMHGAWRLLPKRSARS